MRLKTVYISSRCTHIIKRGDALVASEPSRVTKSQRHHTDEQVVGWADGNERKDKNGRRWCLLVEK